MRLPGVHSTEIVERITDGVISLDVDWHIRYINPAGLSLLGRAPAEDLTGKIFFSELSGLAGSSLQAACERAMQQQSPAYQDCICTASNRWLVFRLYPAPAGLTLLFTDSASIQHMSQETLSRARQNFTTLYNAAQRLRKLLTPEQLSQEIIAVMEDFLDYSYGAVLLIDESDGQSLLPFALSMQKHGPEFLEQDRNYIRSRGPRVGLGITGWVAQHGQSLRSGDVTSDPRYFSMRTDIHSELCVPLILQERVIGVVNIETTRPDAYTPEDQELLEAIAAQIAVSIQNSRLYANTRARLAELEAIQAVSQALNSSLDSAAIVRSTLHELQDLFSAEFIGHIRVEEGSGRLLLDEFLGNQPGGWSPGDELPRGAGMKALQSQGGAILVPRLGDNENFAPWYQNAPKLGNVTFMASVIWNEDWQNTGARSQPAGILLVARGDPPPYTHAELDILKSITAMLTVTFQNARLYENLQNAFAEREKARQMLVQSEKISALGRLAASLAHEINNPLQAMQGCLTLIQEEMAMGGDRSRIDQYTGILQTELERVATLVREMREYSRPSRQIIRLVDLNEVLGNVLTLTAKQLDARRIQVLTRFSVDLPAVPADPDHFKQVFMNMVLNASEAMPTGGTLIVSSRIEPVPGRRRARQLVFEFSDTGCGMTPDMLQKMFEPFFTAKETGAGLGLYISYNLIQSYNGSITASSQVDHGTTFTIRLPIPKESRKHVRTASPHPDR